VVFPGWRHQEKAAGAFALNFFGAGRALKFFSGAKDGCRDIWSKGGTAISFVINITNVQEGVCYKYNKCRVSTAGLMKIRKVAGLVCYKYNKDFRRWRLFVINITKVLVGFYPE
jgi:hypothetical protein